MPVNGVEVFKSVYSDLKRCRGHVCVDNYTIDILGVVDMTHE